MIEKVIQVIQGNLFQHPTTTTTATKMINEISLR